MTNIGKNIKLARQRKNMTQDELALKLFVTRWTVSNYELGRTQPDVEMLLAIAKALDTDMEALACLTKLAPRNLPRARLALQILSGVYLIAILPLLFWPTKPSAPMNLAYLLLVTTPGHTGLRIVFLLLGVGLWLFRPAPPREQSSM